jgi:hypothetical protein
MKAIVFFAILGLSLAGGFLPIARNQFFGVDIGNLVSDGINVVKDVADGNEGQALSSGIDVAGDLIGNHDLAVDAQQTVEDAVDGKGLAQVAEDGLKTVGDVTDYKDAISDGIQTVQDISNGAGLGKVLEDGATLVGDATGERDLAVDGIKTVNDIASGKASATDLAQDGISLAGDLTGNQKLAGDINSGISDVQSALGNSEEFFYVAPVEIISGEEVIEETELVQIPIAFLNEMF